MKDKTSIVKPPLRGGGLLLVLCFTLNCAYAQLTLTGIPAPIQSLSPAQLDFGNVQNSSWMFTLQITNNYTRDTTAQLAGEFVIALADGRRYESPPAVTLRTARFSVPSLGRSVTNLDIGPGAGLIGLESHEFSSEAENTVRETALSTGQVPAGRYTLNLWLVDFAGQPLPAPSNRVTIVYDIPNLSRVELLSPRDGEELFGVLPFFEWLFNGDVTLKVARLASGQSPEDALSTTPLQLQVDLQGQSSYQVPVGGRPWDPGDYAWTIEGHRRGGGDVRAQIWRFRIGSSASTAATGSTGVLNQLQQLLGPDFQSIMDQLGLQNMNPTGKFSLNGQVVTQARLLELVNQLMRNRDRIISATVE